MSALELYSAKLAQEPVEDVIAAIERMQELPRQAGEPSLPEIGVFLAMTRTAGCARENRIISRTGEAIVRVRCTNCGREYSVYIPKGGSYDGICPQRTRAATGEEVQCNGQLIEFWREAA